MKWLERGARKRKRKRPRTDGLCICAGLFLWGSVCVFQLWTVDYAKIHEDVSLSVCLSALVSLFCVFLQRRIANFFFFLNCEGGKHISSYLSTLWHLQEMTDLLRCSESAPVRRRQPHCSNSQQGWTWQRSCCYTLAAPCPALIHCSVLQHDNPTHMAQPRTP